MALSNRNIFYDSETLGLDRGSGTYGASFYEPGTGALHEFFFNPHYVATGADPRQEGTKLATSSRDHHELITRSTWLGVGKDQLLHRRLIQPDASDEQVRIALEQLNPLLAEAWANHPGLGGVDQAGRAQVLAAHGVKSHTQTRMNIQDFVGAQGPAAQLLRGKVLWGQNIGFDSKQLGAVLGAQEQLGVPNQLKTLFSTRSSSSNDPFFVTGHEVNLARNQSLLTGDWTRTWEAYEKYTPDVGPAEVRDVQDVTKAVMSYGQKLGLLDQGKVFYGTGLDQAYRILGALDKDPTQARAKLLSKEYHRDAEDLVIHQQVVLDRMTTMARDLRDVQEGTVRGQELLQQASQGSGGFQDASDFLARVQYLRDDLLRINVHKRLGRAQQDLLETGESWQFDGYKWGKAQVSDFGSGVVRQTPILQPTRTSFTNLEDVAKHLQNTGEYGATDVLAEARAVQESIKAGANVPEKQGLLRQHLNAHASQVQDLFVQHQEQLLKLRGTATRVVSNRMGLGAGISRAGAAAAGMSKSKILMGWAAGAVALGIGGMIGTAMGRGERERSGSVVNYDYQQWLAHQGMSSGGMNEAIRQKTTDFGSPYRGPVGSDQVLREQALLQEREKWLREQYWNQHYDPDQGIMTWLKTVSRSRHQGYSFHLGKPVQGGSRGLADKQLNSLNLRDWKVQVQDADTLTLRRGGLRGYLLSAVGLNKSYSFRLSGIDAPETFHPGSFAGAQPHAEESKAALERMVRNGSNLELLFDTNDSSYGRSMAVLMDGKKNLNYELVKQGQAAHLPYGNPKEALVSYSKMKHMQEQAAEGGRGMWSQPFFKAFHDSTVAGESLTLNTLTDARKIVQQQGRMDVFNTMMRVQEQGSYGASDSRAASAAGRRLHKSADQVLPDLMDYSTGMYNSYLDQMLVDNQNFTRTHGTGTDENKFSRKGGYGELDQGMALDSTRSGTSVMTKRRFHALETYKIDRERGRQRKVRMAELQRAANYNITQSPIGHHEYR